jgi:hypothetical protein
MNVHEYIKVGAMVPVSNDTTKELIDFIRQQQEEIKNLKQQVAFLEDWRDTWSPFLKAITGKVNEK